MAELITLEELKTHLEIDATNTRHDDLYTQLIPWASRAIINYAERDFGAPAITEERIFEYDGSGYLDIDDASSITAVKLTVPYGSDLVLDSAYEWMPMPFKRDDSIVYWYIVLPGVLGQVGFSGEMGFTQNLDMLAAEGRLRWLPQVAKVTGVWGWPVVPEDVKLATALTVRELGSRPDGEALTAEAIEGWSRSWGGRMGGQQAVAIPHQARDLLIQYQRQRV